MKILAPFEVTDAVLASSTVPEADYAEWASGTAYTIGQKVIRASLHKVFEALTANAGKAPESNPTDWLDLGATNRWRMFDQKVGTKTTATTSMTMTFLAPQIVQGVSVLEVDARTVTVTVTDATDGEVYSKTTDMQAPISSSSWWNYFFEPYSRRTSAIFDGMPSYMGATVSVHVAASDGEPVSCGVCIVGSIHKFAEAVAFGASIGIQDYSKKESDEWGNLQIAERAFSKRASWDVLIQSRDVDLLQKTLSALRARPAVYIGGDNYDGLVIYGFYKDLSIVISYPKFSDCSIELEGLV